MNTLAETWTSNTLRYARPGLERAAELKRVFDSNIRLKDCDPTFDTYPLEEFAALIGRERSNTWHENSPQFFIRCIEDGANGVLLGYLQLEIHAPSPGRSWLPMLVLEDSTRGRGIGSEAVESVIAQLRSLGGITDIGLNVYAENVQALRFWFLHGFRHLTGVDLEESHGRTYTCITLTREL